MEPLTQSLVWCIVQVTLIAALAWLLCWGLARWTGPTMPLVPAAALAAIVALTACAFAPWPAWWRYGPGWQGAALSSEAPQAGSFRLPGGTLPSAAHDESSEAAAGSPSTLGTAIDEPATAAAPPAALSDLPPAPSLPGAQPEFTEPHSAWLPIAAWLPATACVMLVAGIVLGLIQLVAGLFSVRAYRRASQPLADKGLAELADCLRAELSLTRPVELRESDHLATAATVGWRRPVILLPRSWRSWTDDQCRAVLAHELAHVARGDYLACVLAQLSVALHFYHPLVHWLAARLRLEQELAADATAAELTGGRRTYLQSLAELALHTTERPLGWPAHTFLPTQGTFLRRIEMLRDTKRTSSGPSSWRRLAAGWAAVGLLLVGAAVIAGLRGEPAASPWDNEALAQAPAAAGDEGQAKTNGGINLSHVPNDAKMLLAIRPAAVLEAPEIRKAFDEATSSGPSPLRIMSLEGVEQITLIGQSGVDPDDWGKDAIAVVQFSRPTTFADLAKAGAFPEDATRVDGRLTVLASVPAYGVIDERTLALGVSGQLARYVANRRKGQPAIAAGAAWEKVQMGALVAALDVEVVREQFRNRPPGTAGAAPADTLAGFAPLWTDSEYALAGVIVEGKTVHLRAIATCHDGQLAENVADTAQASVTLLRNLLRTTRERERNMPGFAVLALDTADGLLKSVKVERADTLVVAQTKTDLKEQGADAAGRLFGAISDARTSAQKMTSSNNLKQIAIALHNFADQNGGRFPPPVVMGKDGKGKAPHSWRVALLPYLAQDQLYRQYNFDEPWDSETNKKVLAQMPQIYRHPLDDPKSTSSGYFVLRPARLLEEKPVDGPGDRSSAAGGDAAAPGIAAPGFAAPVGGFPTAFSDKNGMSFGQMFDGTSNVLAVAEAKRDIPWTKPDDILFDPAKDPPTLGGFFKDGFNAAFCDGRVTFFDSKLEPKVLKLLIMPQDGQPLPKF